MEPEYRENEFPMMAERLVATRIDCHRNGSMFYELSVIRDIDRYLRLDDLRVTLVSEDGSRYRTMEVSEHLNGRKPLMEGLDFVEARIKGIEMYEMHGIWHDYVEVLVVHVKGSPFLSVFVPIDTPTTMRRQIASDVRSGIALMG